VSGRGNVTASQYDRSGDASPQAREARRFANRDPAPYLRTLAGLGCWCGAENGHDWPGKDQGAPHPRDWPGRANGHGFR
jgi:hypothetical protein